MPPHENDEWRQLGVDIIAKMAAKVEKLEHDVDRLKWDNEQGDKTISLWTTIAVSLATTIIGGMGVAWAIHSLHLTP